MSNTKVKLTEKETTPTTAVHSRYSVEWSHHSCHIETCSHVGNYRVYDSIGKYYMEYSDDKEYLEIKYLD